MTENKVAVVVYELNRGTSRRIVLVMIHAFICSSKISIFRTDSFSLAVLLDYLSQTVQHHSQVMSYLKNIKDQCLIDDQSLRLSAEEMLNSIL